MRIFFTIFIFLFYPLILQGEDVNLFLKRIDPEASIFYKESLISFEGFGNDEWICSMIGKINEIIKENPFLKDAYRIRNYYVQALVQDAVSQGEKVYWSKIGLKYVNQARKKFPDDNVFKFWSILFYSEANFYLNSKIFFTIAPKIVALTERIIKNDPECCRGIPLLLLGSLYLKLPPFPISVGSYKKSEHFLKMYTKYFPEVNMGHLRLAELYYFEGKIDSALREIEKARKVNPNTFLEYYDYLLYRNGIDEFEKAIKRGQWDKTKDLMLMLRKWSLSSKK